MSQSKKPSERDAEVKLMAEASMRAMDSYEGQKILDKMADGSLPIADGLAALLVLSGNYEYREQ